MHHKWLRSLRWEHGVDRIVFDQYLLAIEQLLERLQHIDTELKKLSESEAYREPVGWLRCLRGIDTVAAMTIVCEVHDFRRFESPRQLMSYLGLTPSEHSSGTQQNKGGITKAGNSHARRMLIEVCWHYRHRAGVGAGLRARRDEQPGWAIAITDKAQLRLCRRYQRLVARGKPSQKAVTAIARELVGFVWALMRSGRSIVPKGSHWLKGK